MSNNVDATNMKQATKRELKPKLRFPEFRDAGEWDEKRLDEMFDFHSTANNSRADLSNAGNFFYIHYGDIHTKFHQYIDFSKDAIPKIPSSLYKNATFLKNGDLVIADASEDTEGIAKAVEVRGIEHGVKAISGLHTILLRDSRQNYINGFKGLLREIAGVKKQIKRLAVGVKVYSVSKTVLKQVLLPLPSHPEQQKIADCLSSIDELITAQTQKLNTLKTHKKGLMQHLFPAEGETLPKLRFPEFLDSGEWDKDELRKVSVFVNERMPLDQISLSTYVSTVNILPDYEGLETASKLPPSGSATRFKKNDILISNIRPYLKKVWFANKEGGASNDVIVVRAKENVCDRYLSFMLKNDVFIEYVMKGAKGVKMPRGDIFLMQEYPLAYPSKPEQQKIAECLSSIDELITAQTQKLATLKTHKKAMMQQLFPAIEEVLR